MKKIIILSLVTIVAVFASGCRSFTSPARSHKLESGKISWLDYDATRRGALVVPAGEKVRIISEPSPDVALGVVADFVAKGSYSGISAEASAKVTESISELGKRTQTIMFLRESLYRIGELQASREDLTKDEIKQLYLEVLKAALELAKADNEKATAEKAKAVETLIKTVDPKDKEALIKSLNLK